jgi:hypothetical protein
MNKFHKILSTLTLSFVALLPLASPADAISFTLNLNWNGISSNGITPYSLTGTFTADDLNNDGFISATNSDFSEVTDFAVTFTKDPNMDLVVYNFGEITSDPSFTFNYDIVNNTILQSGSDDPLEVLSALYIGNRTSPFSGFSLDSFSVSSLGFLRLIDVNDVDNAQGGVITASPVPFEFEASGGILMLGAAWVLRKKLQKKTVND